MSPCQDYKDLELVTLLIRGDREAFVVIYQKYARALLSYARKSISSKEDCEEIMQDVFTSLWVRHQELQHVTALRAYLFKMVRYKIVDYIRHSLVKKQYEEHYILFEAVYDNLDDASDDPVELQALIDKKISELPARCQTAFRLRLHDNLTYKDIALRMNISIKTVEKHISAGLQHLRNAYQEAYKV